MSYGTKGDSMAQQNQRRENKASKDDRQSADIDKKLNGPNRPAE